MEFYKASLKKKLSYAEAHRHVAFYKHEDEVKKLEKKHKENLQALKKEVYWKQFLEHSKTIQHAKSLLENPKKLNEEFNDRQKKIVFDLKSKPENRWIPCAFEIDDEKEIQSYLPSKKVAFKKVKNQLFVKIGEDKRKQLKKMAKKQ
jgi:hypothetical protein